MGHATHPTEIVISKSALSRLRSPSIGNHAPLPREKRIGCSVVRTSARIGWIGASSCSRNCGVSASSPLKGRVALRASDEIHVPMCFGLRNPMVLLPASGEPRLAPEVLACVLLHELVHLERRDTWQGRRHSAPSG